jgi:hypothetical protein
MAKWRAAVDEDGHYSFTVPLKGRTMTPPVELFLDRLREHVRKQGL